MGPSSVSAPEPVGDGEPPKSAEVVMAGLGLAPAPPEPPSLEPVEPESELPPGAGACVGAGTGVQDEVQVDAEVDEAEKVGTAVAVPSAPMMTT